MSIHLPRIILVAFAATIFLASVALAQSQDSPSRPPVDGEAISDEALELLGETVSLYVDQQQAVGAELLVMQRGKTLFHESFGYVDRESKRRWEKDTICNIRSMTKPITSTAAQLLIDRGSLKLDAPVAEYLESFDNEQSKSITVRQVLTHRSGFPLTNLSRVDQYASLVEQVAAAGNKGPEYEPGSKFWYSDVGTDVVGALVETVSKQPLHEFVSQEILQPLGMNATFYGIDASDPRFPGIASLYLKEGKGWKAFWKPEDKPFYPFAWGSQTVYSTTSDYAKFLTLFLNGGRVGDRQLLSPAAIDRMLAAVSKMKMLGADAPVPTGFQNLEVFYGQMMATYRPPGEIDKGPVIFGHSGSDGTWAWAWPQQELVVAFFTQSRGTLAGIELESAIDRLVIRGDVAGFRKEMLARQSAETSLSRYEGIYWDEDAETAYYAVIVEDGDLIIERPGRFRVVATPQSDAGQFAMQGGLAKIEFDRAADPAASMKLITPTRSEVQRRHKSAADLPALEDVIAKVKQAHAIGQLDQAGVVKLTGTIKMTAQGLEGKVVRWFDNQRSRLDVDLGATRVSLITDGKAAARSIAEAPLQRLDGVAEHQSLLSHPAIQLGDWRRGYSHFQVLKKVQVEGDDQLMVRATKTGMPGATFIVNLDSGLVVGEQRLELLPGAGFVGLGVSYSDFRQVAGMNLPFHIESKYPHPLLGQTIIQYESFEIDVEESDLFVLPDM